MKRVFENEEKERSVRIQMVFWFNDEQLTTLIGAGNNEAVK